MSNFQTLVDLNEELRATNSSSDKQAILGRYKDDSFIKKVLLYTYHPFKQYHVTSKNLKKRQDLTNIGKQSDLFGGTKIYDDFFELLDDLHNQKITGHDAIAAVNTFIQQNKPYEDELYNIIDRNLKTRATTTLINKVIPKLIPEFDVALAQDYQKHVEKIDFDTEDYYESRKLDGVRCICKIDHIGDSEFISRNGKPFLTLGVIADYIKSSGVTNIVLDGEICLVDANGVDDFQGVLKQIQKKNHTIANPKYKVFDVLTHEEFDSLKGDVCLTDRWKRFPFPKLQAHNKIPIELLVQERVESKEKLEESLDAAVNEGWEGLIIRKDTNYVGKRNHDMLKVKKFYDEEYTVTGTIMEKLRIIKYEHPDGTQYYPFDSQIKGHAKKDLLAQGFKSVEVKEELLSAITIEHKGNTVKVGSGFSLKERYDFHKDPSKIVGKEITVKYFEETTDQHGNHSLRFPVFKALYENGRQV